MSNHRSQQPIFFLYTKEYGNKIIIIIIKPFTPSSVSTRIILIFFPRLRITKTNPIGFTFSFKLQIKIFTKKTINPFGRKVRFADKNAVEKATPY